jgi:hypothetical protein
MTPELDNRRSTDHRYDGDMSARWRVNFRMARRWIIWILIQGGTAIIGTALLLLSAQCLIWLRRGLWPTFDLRMIWGVPSASIFASLSGLPIWIALLLLGGVMFFVGSFFDRKAGAHSRLGS